MKAGIFAMVGLALAGCAGVPATGDTNSLLADSLFATPAQPPRGDQVFALSEGMREFLDGELALALRKHGRNMGLYEAMRSSLRIEYDSVITRNAAQTFAARSGNCLSLVILMSAFARELKIPVEYQSVYGYEGWSRSGDVAFHITHVNLVLGEPYGIDVVNREPRLTVDFLPPSSAAALNARSITEATVVAMYLNNRAAETMAGGDPNGGYWWAREAIRTDPGYLNTYNTLGVIYLRHGNLPEAEHALRYIVEREPENTDALSNLARVLAGQGRTAEAQQVKARLASIAPYPPFYFFDQGLAALVSGDYRKALTLLERELVRMPYNDELHFALAMTHLHLGEVRRARKHMNLALENSTTHDRHDLYAAQLQKIDEAQVH